MAKKRTPVRAWSRAQARKALTGFGPPNEWSGAVAAILGPERRKLLKSVWEAMTTVEKTETQQKFEASFRKASEKA